MFMCVSVNAIPESFYILRHTVVCHAALESTQHHEYIDRKKENMIVICR